ncbi:cytochrome b561 and DOMON domain-containing protein At4g17280-like [Quercus robur]|uniref:cytochrome b561 and DOMON domain-containing protein At4g17280-like n=1 Tax=Quercus robur TaxID=38942 RepID=UPI0021622EC1|nr:cytochrome b561 and DOMON domain-containing protein At4g17280-like [Quercus robur]
MSKALTTLLFSCILFSLSVSSYAQTCKSYTFSSNTVYASCQDLPVLNAFLHYNYSSTANTLDLAYRVTGATATNWISWAINPNGQQMAGSQALVAFQNSSGAMRVFTSSVASTSIATLSESALSFGVSNLNGSFVNGEMTIFATLTLSSGMTTVNQVWQVGPVSGDNPQSHDTSSNAANMRSVGTLNLLNGTTASGGGTS